jgi:hypothetical protein
LEKYNIIAYLSSKKYMMFYTINDEARLSFVEGLLNTIPKYCDFFKGVLIFKSTMLAGFPEGVEIIPLEPQNIET